MAPTDTDTSPAVAIQTTDGRMSSQIRPKGERPERRTYTADYKLRILKEADEGSPGATAALLRREGLYSSHLGTWRQQRARGELAGLTAVKRGPKPDSFAAERRELNQEITRLKTELEKARTIIDVQKKVSQLLGLLSPNPDATASDPECRR
jgi:transposase-like protein